MTISDKKEIDHIIANNGVANPTDTPFSRITQYDNAWGGIGYGCDFVGEGHRYTPSEFVRNPRIIFERDETKP